MDAFVTYKAELVVATVPAHLLKFFLAVAAFALLIGYWSTSAEAAGPVVFGPDVPTQAAVCDLVPFSAAGGYHLHDQSMGDHDSGQHDHEVDHDAASCCAIGCLSGLLPGALIGEHRTAFRDWSWWPGDAPPPSGSDGLFRPPRVSA
ncbi:MAG: hypothetical protein RLN67_07335 [Algiphilus sp.]